MVPTNGWIGKALKEDLIFFVWSSGNNWWPIFLSKDQGRKETYDDKTRSALDTIEQDESAVLDTERGDPDKGSRFNSQWHIMNPVKRTTCLFWWLHKRISFLVAWLDFRVWNKVSGYRALTIEVSCPLRLQEADRDFDYAKCNAECQTTCSLVQVYPPMHVNVNQSSHVPEQPITMALACWKRQSSLSQWFGSRLFSPLYFRSFRDDQNRVKDPASLFIFRFAN